jgi:hypothetical protein
MQRRGFMEYMGEGLYMTEVASPLFGAAVSTADELHSVALYANEFASPGASTLVVDECPDKMFYANEFASPGASTLVVDGVVEAVFYATEVASPKKVDIL